MSCSHQRSWDRWVEEEDWYHGGMVGRWETYTESTTVDIDLHRYKCTMCNQVLYYSGAARDYYEKGVDSKGLFQR